MKKSGLMAAILATALLTACSSAKKEQVTDGKTAAMHTQETAHLLSNLKKNPFKRYYVRAS